MVDTTTAALRSLAPIVATIATFTTLVVCVILTKTRDVYVGDLHWPYFSDIGRDPPGYYVFCTGLSTVTVALATTWVFNALYQRTLLTKLIASHVCSTSVKRASVVAGVFAVTATIGLPVLAFFDTSSYPSTHNYAAYAFFLLQTVAISINAVVSATINKGAERIQDNNTNATLDAQFIASRKPLSSTDLQAASHSICVLLPRVPDLPTD